MLKERLRQALVDQAQAGNLTTYKELAGRLGLEPPQTIHRVAVALETLMEGDVAAGRPMLAALCVSKTHSGIPGHGFFLKAQALGSSPAIRRARRRRPFTRMNCNGCFHSTEASVPS